MRRRTCYIVGQSATSIARLSNLLAIGADHQLTVLFGERPHLRGWQYIEDLLGGPAQRYAPGGDDEWSVDQDRVAHHRIEQLVVG